MTLASPTVRTAELSGWGRLPRRVCQFASPRDTAELKRLLALGKPVIARGAGRAYGDAALGVEDGLTILMHRFNRVLAFDPIAGEITAEAGVAIGDLVRVVLRHGWFPLVTPGTQHATLGGMIASNVHGKNHTSVGSFDACVCWMDLMTAAGEVVRITRASEPATFDASHGGMGLTGIILRARLRLQRVETGWIRERVVSAPDLDAGLRAHSDPDVADAPYSVAWIDALATGAHLGRMLIHLGAHAASDDLSAGQRPYDTPTRKRVSVPDVVPNWVLSGPLMRAFNNLHWRKGLRDERAGERLVDWESYFYPLDSLVGWNRLYGRRGFVQLQCLLPEATAAAALREILNASATAGLGYLGVLKRLKSVQSMISFPGCGWTLALDVPASPRGLALCNQLEQIAEAAGGRFYLAKDARLPRERLEATDPRVKAFRAFREDRDLTHHFASVQSRRLGL